MAEGYPLEVGRLLYSALSDAQQQSATRDDLSRSWSLELQWFTPEESNSIIEHLCSGGWLVVDAEMLSPASGLTLSMPPLGWRPIPKIILNAPELELDSLPEEDVSPAPISTQRTQEVRISNPGNENIPPDRAENSIPSLIEIISNGSGLQNKEVLRRAQRKRRALGPVTLWMALALVAREQGLDMDVVVSSIDLESG
ncbi:MAG: DUF2240 family protein [Candidatus Thalassarchaeum sp.]